MVHKINKKIEKPKAKDLIKEIKKLDYKTRYGMLRRLLKKSLKQYEKGEITETEFKFDVKHLLKLFT